MKFDRDNYLRDCLVRRMKAYPFLRRVLPMSDGISYETRAGKSWNREKMSKEEVSRVSQELWPNSK
jgi:hypothetical protein